jgi:MFS family permease
VVSEPTVVVVVLAVLAGGARGLLTLVGAPLVSDYWGRERYAAISGVYNAPMLAAGALSPLLGAVVVGLTGGYVGLFVVLAGAAALAAVLAASVRKAVAPHPREIARWHG